MTEDVRKLISREYCPRFGNLAVELGFVTEAQLAEGLARQVHDELSGNGHKLLGRIMFDADWMSAAQIDQVMTELAQRMRAQR